MSGSRADPNREAEIEAAILRAKKVITDRGDFRRALAILSETNRRWPGSLKIQLRRAKLMCDYGDAFPPAQRGRMRGEATRILRRMCRRLKGVNYELQYSIRREYYWSIGDSFKQFEIGSEAVSRGLKIGHHSAAVGSAWYAKELMERGQRRRAKRWAAISEKAWQRLFRALPVFKTHYNSYLHYALAVGLRGDRPGAEKLLTFARKICGSANGEVELQTIRDVLDRLELPGRGGFAG
jgi:hypothetical protein